MKVKDCLEYFNKTSYPYLFDKEGLLKLDNVKKVYGNLETEETILEISLSEEKRDCDYSIRINTDSILVKEYWYELDAEICNSHEMQPCYFIDASSVRPNQDNTIFYQNALIKMAGADRIEKRKDKLEQCVKALDGKCQGLFQLGVMESRGQTESLRVFTQAMKKEDFIAYLQEIGWNGDKIALEQWLKELEPYCGGKKFILDFDIESTGISEKIGINFGTIRSNSKTVRKWLSFLEEKNLCLSEKREDILRFIETFPSHTPFLQNDISHFKLPFQQGKITKAKAYLRQGSICYQKEFRAYSSPILMNLELTTRCPLRCPQCYCDFSEGKDMDFQTALYWVKEAEKNKVKTINLSGGETMCYPYLEQLIQECSKRGIEANIAVSGYGIQKEKLQRLIESGTADICVSLNGATEEINKLSRDGYALAIHTLELLKELKYSRTCINWVMHSHNAENLPQMLQLAEDYQVQSLTVIMFKPDAAYQLPSIPNKEQMQKVVKWIKSYQGSVKIQVEECFSQLRALLGQKFFINFNQGVSRGCGAGRDGISVSVNGKLTPCRHLPLEEEWDTIAEYWEKSAVLEKLRLAEDTPMKDCSQCKYQKYCLPCMAVNWKLEGEIYMGNSQCPAEE